MKAYTGEIPGCHGFNRRERELGSDKAAKRLGGPGQDEH